MGELPCELGKPQHPVPLFSLSCLFWLGFRLHPLKVFRAFSWGPRDLAQVRGLKEGSRIFLLNIAVHLWREEWDRRITK